MITFGCWGNSSNFPRHNHSSVDAAHPGHGETNYPCKLQRARLFTVRFELLLTLFSAVGCFVGESVTVIASTTENTAADLLELEPCPTNLHENLHAESQDEKQREEQEDGSTKQRRKRKGIPTKVRSTMFRCRQNISVRVFAPIYSACCVLSIAV